MRKLGGGLVAFMRQIENLRIETFLKKRIRAILVLATSLMCVPQVAEAQSILTDSDWPAALGRGYDSHLGRIADGCVTGKLAYRGNRYSTLSSHYDESFGSYMTLMDGKLSGGVNLLLVSGSASVDYYSRVASSELSTSYTIRFVAELGTAVLDQRTLTTAGNSAAQVSPIQRRAICGDEYISEAKLGSELLISASFLFSDSSEHERFVTTVKVEALFGLVSHTESWTDETQSFSQTGYLKVESLQRGGNPSLHQSILNGHGSVVCRFDNVAPCQQLLQDLIDYAGSPTGYVAQFSKPYNLSELALLGYRTSRYEDSGHDSLVVPPAGISDFDIRQITRQMIDEYAYQKGLLDRANTVLTMALSSSRRVQVQRIKASLGSNISNLERALWVCRTNSVASVCRAARSDEIANRQPVLPDDLYF
jgi:hypothetical protein